MTTLITIPRATAYHIPSKGAQPLELSSGNLILIKVPADPPAHPQPTLTLSIGNSASFPLSEKSPLRKVESTAQHASYTFVPILPNEPGTDAFAGPHASSSSTSTVPTGGLTASPAISEVALAGQTFGRIKIVFGESSNQVEYDAQEVLARKFEEFLKENKVWKEASFFEDEDGQDIEGFPQDLAGYGAALANRLSSYGSYISKRIEDFTEKHINDTPKGNTQPSQGVKDAASTLNTSTDTLKEYTHTAAETLSSAVQAGAKALGAFVKAGVETVDHQFQQSSQPAGQSKTTTVSGGLADNVPKEVKDGVAKAKEVAGDAWDDVSLAASGAADGISKAASSAATNTHKIVEHDYSKEMGGVSRDVGQAGSNVGSAATEAFVATSLVKHGKDASDGYTAGYQNQG